MATNFKLQFRKEYFLFLLPVFFVLHGYTENFPLIKEGDGWLLLLQYLLVSFALCILFFLVFQSWRKASVLVFLVMSFYFFFGSLHDAAKSILGKSLLLQYSFILPFCFVLFFAFMIFLKKTNRTFIRFSNYINFLLLILIVIDGIQLTLKTIKAFKQNHAVPSGFLKCDDCNKPDIYFIIADEYAGKKELNDIFHFDNSLFENELKQRGFFIIDSSFSNYNYTPFSVASILSMNYLKGIEGRNQSKADRHICYDLINQNGVIDFLKAERYAVKNYSVFELDNQLPQAHSAFVLTGKELLTAQTFLSRIDRDIRFNLITKYKFKREIQRFAKDQANNVEYLYDKTKEEANKSSSTPRFIYTHLMMPHYPYLFDKNGNKTIPEMALEGNQANQKAYIEYIQYSNNKFVKLIDDILKNSKRPPIIIFMGDHGFRQFEKDVNHHYYFMNFNAVYLPDKNYVPFYKDMSAVNEFRILFNTQFNQHLPLLKDSTSFLTE